MKKQRSESGQVLVLIILAMVALMGFAALAVDGGNFYAERRRAQNAADAASMAAARIGVDGADSAVVQQTGLDSALINGFNNNGLTNTVQINNPPVSGPYLGNGEYYQVLINQQVNLTFAQFIFKGPLAVSVEAVAHGRMIDSAAGDNALHATNSDAGIDAILFDGGVDAQITGGNIFSNANLRENGSGSVHVTGGQIKAALDWTKRGGSGTLSPSPIGQVGHQTVPDITPPDCVTGLQNRSASGRGDLTIQPGRYQSGWDVKGHWTLEPGMYCIWDGITVNGGGSLNGTGVFLVLMNGAGIKYNGGGEINLVRPNDIADGSGNHYGGMLIYATGPGGDDLVISGNASTHYTGSIYAPTRHCDIGGTSGSIALRANVICDTAKIHGNADVSILFRENENYKMPPIVELAQ